MSRRRVASRVNRRNGTLLSDHAESPFGKRLKAAACEMNSLPWCLVGPATFASKFTRF